MDIRQDNPRTNARNFALRGVAWSLGLFGLVRLSWIETHAVLPLTQVQGRVAEYLFGTAKMPIEVTLACSGADAVALCAGAILAYPARWRMRLGGASVGIALTLVLNAVRIGTLGRAVASPWWFNALHVYIWPGLLTLSVAAFVFGWMRFADDRGAAVRIAAAPADSSARPAGQPLGLTWRFVALTAAFLVVFTAASPLYLQSAGVLALATFVATAGAGALGVLGIQAYAAANVLWTARGGFLVTQECISTPLIPVYLAAVFAYAQTWRRCALALLAAVPLFIGLGIARLLVIALPAALVASPVVLVHAFYQLLLAAVLVFLAALWRHGAGPMAWRRTLMGIAAGTGLVYVLGAPYTRLLTSAFAAGVRLDDPQGAVALLPAFQVGLYVALCVAAFAAVNWRRLATGFALLAMSQVVIIAALHFAVERIGVMPEVRDVRAWAVAGPLLLVAALITSDAPRR